MEPDRYSLHVWGLLITLLFNMPTPPSWTPGAPQFHPGADGGAHGLARVGKEQAAQQLLGLLHSPRIKVKGRLPYLMELPRTSLSVHPKNSCRGIITFKDPVHRNRVADHCFLQTDTEEEMSSIAGKYEEYASACFSPGESPLERFPLEILRQITERLWNNDELWHDSADVKRFSATSRTIRGRLLEAQKVSDLEKWCHDLPKCPADSINDEFDAIASYALSDSPVKLIGESRLAAFKHFARGYSSARSNARVSISIRSSAFLDAAIKFIEGMPEHDAVKSLSLLNDFPEPVFNSLFMGLSEPRAEKLLGVVTRTKNADVKADADGIAAVANLLRLSGSISRWSIAYVLPLVELAEDLEEHSRPPVGAKATVSSDALKKTGSAFVKVRDHLAFYCSIHYDPSNFRYRVIHNADDDTEENKKADLATGMRLDAFLLRQGFDMSRNEGATFHDDPIPLWRRVSS